MSESEAKNMSNTEIPKIILAGKDKETISIISSALNESGYKTIIVEDESTLLSSVKSEMPAIILLESEMPHSDGMVYIEQIRNSQSIRNIPIVMLIPRKSVNLIEKCFFQGATDYIPLPVEIYELIGRVKNLVFYGIHKQELESQEVLLSKKVTSLVRETDNLNKALLNIIEHTSDNIDKKSYAFLKKFSESCAQLALVMGAPSDFAHRMRLYAPSYDIGKIMIPTEIMNKSGKLSPEEFDIVKTHVLNGQTMFQDYPMDVMLSNIIQFHHEKWDGSGYIKGLKGNEIPLEAQIVSLMDVYIALISDKVYKNGFTHQEAVNIIRDSSGMQFQPRLVQAFLKIEAGIAKLFRKK